MYVISPQNEYEQTQATQPRSSILGRARKFFWLIIIALIIIGGYIGIHFVSAARTIIVGEEGSPISWKGVLGKWLTNDDEKLIPQDPYPMPEKEENRLDILILGIRGDDGTEQAGNLLTDTMVLVSIDKTSGKSSMVSLPRDLYIDMKGKLADGDVITINGKINEIYVRGLQHNQGLALTSQMVSRLTGTYVDHAVLFDFKAFGQIVDALGGVDITLAKPFTEKTQWKGDSAYEFSLPAGPNHLNGEQALYYVRSRYSSSDFDRARRQQEVMFAIKKKATELGFLANPAKITEMLEALKGNVRTNIQIWEIKNLISYAQKIRGDTLKTSVLTTETLLYETHLENGEYVLLPKGDDFKIIREYFKTLLLE